MLHPPPGPDQRPSFTSDPLGHGVTFVAGAGSDGSECGRREQQGAAEPSSYFPPFRQRSIKSSSRGRQGQLRVSLLLPGQLSLSCRPLVEHGGSLTSSPHKRSNFRAVLLLVGALTGVLRLAGCCEVGERVCRQFSRKQRQCEPSCRLAVAARGSMLAGG